MAGGTLRNIKDRIMQKVSGPGPGEDDPDAPNVGAKIDAWLEHFDVDLKVSKAFLRAVETERLTFDAESETFTYILKSPLRLDNGESLSVFKMCARKANTGAMMQASKSAKDNEFQVAVRLISSITDQPMGVIERLKINETTVLAEILGFFVS